MIFFKIFPRPLGKDVSGIVPGPRVFRTGIRVHERARVFRPLFTLPSAFTCAPGRRRRSVRDKCRGLCPRTTTRATRAHPVREKGTGRTYRAPFVVGGHARTGYTSWYAPVYGRTNTMVGGGGKALPLTVGGGGDESTAAHKRTAECVLTPA